MIIRKRLCILLWKLQAIAITNRSRPEDHMPFNQSPPNPHRIHPSSLDAFASPQIAAELARREQRLAGSAQAAAAGAPAKAPQISPPAQAVAPVKPPAAPHTAPPPVQATAPTATSAAALMTRASELKYWPINWISILCIKLL